VILLPGLPGVSELLLSWAGKVVLLATGALASSINVGLTSSPETTELSNNEASEMWLGKLISESIVTMELNSEVGLSLRGCAGCLKEIVGLPIDNLLLNEL